MTEPPEPGTRWGPLLTLIVLGIVAAFVLGFDWLLEALGLGG